MLRPRVLAPSDLPEVLRVQRNAYHEGLLEPSETFTKKLSLFPQGALGCFDDGALLAYIFCHPWVLGEIVPLRAESLELPEQPTCMYIHDLAVDQYSRGRGLAARLVNEVFELARAMRLPACTLVSVQGSERFWETLGFTCSRELEYLPDIRAHYMVKSMI